MYPNLTTLQTTEAKLPNNIVTESLLQEDELSTGLLPLLFCIESDKTILFFYDYKPNNLNSVIKYSPLFLASNKTRLLFVVYQIVKIFRTFQLLNINIGDVGLKDFVLSDSLCVQLKPTFLSSALIKCPEKPRNVLTEVAAKDVNSEMKTSDNDNSFCDIGMLSQGY